MLNNERKATLVTSRWASEGDPVHRWLGTLNYQPEEKQITGFNFICFGRRKPLIGGKPVMDSERAIPRVECQAMVEDAWRKMLNFAADGSQALGMQCIARLEETMAARAAKLEEPAKSIFLTDVDEERGAIFDEYSANPDALKRRLRAGQFRPREAIKRSSSGTSIINTAVNTAVRATVWESVRAIFRSLR